MSESSDLLIFEVTAEGFDRDVIARSFTTPVVVDFWAEWCAPCRTLGPVLEALASEYAGKFVLAKADTEALADLASRFGVRSIPAVFGVRDGRVVDSFVGALPESSIRTWIDRLLPTPAESELIAARLVEPTDPASAEPHYRAAIGFEPNDPAAKVGLARVLLRLDRDGEVREIISALETRGFLEPEAEAIKADLAVRARGASSGGVESARAALAAEPANPGLRLKLAEALAASGGFGEALELALALVEDRPKALGDEPRRLMLNVFQLMPADSPEAAEYRRKLSAALY